MPAPGITKTLRVRFGLRAFVFSLIIFEILAISSGIYWRSHLMHTVTDGLVVHVESIASELDLGLGDALMSRTAESIYVLPSPETGIQILSEDGVVQAASPRLADEPALVPIGAIAADSVETVTLQHPRFGHVMVATKLTDIGDSSYAVQALASLAEVDRTCRIMCFFVPGAMVVLAALIGWTVFFSVRSSLRPVRLLARRAAEMADRPRPAPLGVTAHTAELKDLSTRLDHLLETIRSTFEREQSFLDDASHELRTPIAIALAELDLALRANPDPATAEALRSSREELRRLDRIAADLLILARERSTGLETVESFDMGDVARRAVSLVQRDPSQRRVRIQVSGTGIATGDSNALERVFTNIIANAVRHCTLAVAVEVGADPGHTWATITDDGPGIPDHLLPDLFDRFTRHPGHQTRSTGLGTAIAAEIVAKQHGSIEAHNLPGGGARVEIRLPAPHPGRAPGNDTIPFDRQAGAAADDRGPTGMDEGKNPTGGRPE